MVHLHQCIKDFEVDIMCMAETGVHWRTLPIEDRLWERVKEWGSDRKISFGYNVDDRLARRSQYGGTAILAMNDIVPRINQTGHDDSGLGRWSWFKIQGKHRSTIRIVSAYCPCQPSSTSETGLHTVFAQHLRSNAKDPIASFWDDLHACLKQWVDVGDKLIVCGDWNCSVVGEKITEFMTDLSLREVLTYRHGDTPPATYQRGSVSIDGIFVSSDFLGCKGGYLEFGATPGDHRGLWIDVPQTALLGYKMPKIPPRKIRYLQSAFPASTKRYKETLHKRFLSQNVYGNIYRLHQAAQHPITSDFKILYEKIDKTMETLKKETAKQCRHKRCGGLAFSDTLQKARQEIHLWSLVKRRLLGCNVHARTIIRARKKTSIQSSNVTLEEATELLSRAHRHYRAVRKRDVDHRIAFQNRLSEERAKAGNVSVATEIKNQKLREEQRRTARRAKYVLERNQRCGTTMIQIKSRGKTIDVTDKSQMERLIIAENEKKYHQTETRCPLLHGQLLADIGLLGEGPEVENILNGTYICPHDTPKAVKLWLENLYIPNRDKRQATVQTLREYRSGWKRVKEYTSSGDLHFGHFKIEAEHDMLSWANYVMAGIPRLRGFTPERWKRGTDVMLLKKEGFFLLEKLRTIVLFESDFNFENKRLGRDAMKLALDKGLIKDEQYSRPGRSAQDNALNKRLTFDYLRLRKQNFGICACDLKSCYDRIVHNAAALALRRVGVRQSDIASMFGTIQVMIHKVRTAFGDSKMTYSADNPEFLLPVQGTGQGNGAAPSVWSIICSTIFEILHKQGFSSAFCYALSQGLYHLSGFAYVDDCDLLYLGDDVDEVFEGLQGIITMWDKLMEVTGAALAPDKCWWYLICFHWKQGKWKCIDEGSAFDLRVRNKNGIEESLKYLPGHEAREMLGVYIAPSGQQSKQIEEMKKKATAWGRLVTKGSLLHHEAWTTLNTTILKSLEYPLAATSLSKTDLRGVVAPALTAGLQASGLSHSFPRAILYAPATAQGLGVQNLFHTQNIRHVKDIVDQRWRQTPSAKFIGCTLEAVKLEAGIAGHLFEYTDTIHWMNTPNLWAMKTLEYCQSYNISFKEPGAILAPKRLRDVLIMDALALYGFSTSTMQAVNRCRLYKQVCTVSDISTGDGKAIHPQAYEKGRMGRRNSYNWPAQGLPSSSDWKMWKAAIDTVFRQDNVFHSGLGHWTLTEEEYYRDWDYFLTSEDDLVQHDNGEWLYYNPFVVQTRRYRRYDMSFVRRRSSTKPRGTLWRTTIQIRHEVGTTQGKDYNVINPVDFPRNVVTRNYRDALRTYPDSVWACTSLTGEEHIPEIRKAIAEGTAMAVSDGSFYEKEHLGAMFWTICDDTGQHRLEGGGMIPGPPSSQNAFRSEAGGLLGVMIMVSALTATMASGSIEVFCDGKSALEKALYTPRHHFSSKNKSFDILSRIIELKENLDIDVIATHVRGHQDDVLDELTLPEQLNVRMDSQAKCLITLARKQNFHPQDCLPQAPYGIGQVYMADAVVTSCLDRTLKEYVSHKDGIEWWIKKGRLTVTSSSMVDWRVVKSTLNGATFGRKKFITKWATGQLPVGTVQDQKNLQHSDKCPRCLEHRETITHVLRCPHRRSIKQWHKGLRNLDTWLRKVGTDPDIVRVIMLALPRWHEQALTDSFCPRNISTRVKEALREQHKIGWDNFFSGLLSAKWSECQDLHFKQRKKRQTGHRWAIKLSNRIWDMNNTQWTLRNSSKYKNKVQDKLQGRFELLYACQLELDFGLWDLDPIFAPYFETDIESLEEEPTSYIKAWFATIRGARETSGFEYHDHDRVTDEIRHWVGLRMDKKFRKGKSTT